MSMSNDWSQLRELARGQDPIGQREVPEEVRALARFALAAFGEREEEQPSSVRDALIVELAMAFGLESNSHNLAHVTLAVDRILDRLIAAESNAPGYNQTTAEWLRDVKEGKV